MKKLNNIPLSDNEILNKYILTYTEPYTWIKELDNFFIFSIDETNNLKLIKYILEEYYDYNNMINHSNDLIRTIYAKYGYNHKNYINDKSYIVRLEVARHGNYHKKLLYDDHPLIRKEIAKQGNYHHILVHDDYYEVRLEIAKQGKYLDILCKDKNQLVKNEAILQQQRLKQSNKYNKKTYKYSRNKK